VNSNLIRFFYKKIDSGISQLVYKSYLNNNHIAHNYLFREQLLTDLKCLNLTKEEVKNLDYKKQDLERVFIRYSKCNNGSFVNFNSKRKKDLFNLTLRPGINYSHLEIENSNSDFFDTDFNNELSLRVGLEAEFILPYNKSKWSFIVEPTYQNYKSIRTIETVNISGGILKAQINYKSIEVPIGIRHYVFLNNDSKFFANASYIIDLSLGSSVDFIRNDGSIINTLKITPRSNLSLGLGYKYKDRYSVEMRYQTSRELLNDYLLWESNYRTFSLIFGYSMF
jgi:hypothetical protein